MARRKKQSVKIPVTHPVEVSITREEIGALMRFVDAAANGEGCPFADFTMAINFNVRLLKSIAAGDLANAAKGVRR